MKLWPFKRAEQRSSAPYTDAIINELVRAAGGEVVVATGVAATEIAAGAWSRALSAGNCDHPAITPSYLACIGRELVRRGEVAHAVSVDNTGMVSLVPVGTWDVQGSAEPSSWRFNATIVGPSTSHTVNLPYEAVVHHRWGSDPIAPWRGVSPLRYAGVSGELLALLETQLSHEMRGPVGSVLALPVDPKSGKQGDDPLSPLKTVLARLRGNLAFVESTSAMAWEDGKPVPRSDWQQRRVGASPPEVLKGLRSDVGEAILQACGVPISLATDADGTSQRESWRRFVMGSVAPKAGELAAELSDKLDSHVQFDFSDLWAHDLQGRATSVKQLAAAGVPVEDARKIAGV